MARPKQRETYGNGSITPEMRDGAPLRDTWRICISLGTDADGKRRKVQKVFHGSLSDARKLCKQMNAQYEHVDVDSSKMAFQEACDTWLAYLSTAGTCAPSKLKDYRTRLGYMASALGDKPLISIKQSDIESAITAIKDSRGLSQRTLKDILSLSRRVFRYALSNEWIVRNPCEGVASPKAEEAPKRQSLSPGEVARLRSALDRSEEDIYRSFSEKERRQFDNGTAWGRSRLNGLNELSALIAVRIMLATGIRRGEALGLTWNDVDFDAQSLVIRQTYNKDMVLKAPKTAAGARSLVVDQGTMSRLARWKEVQARFLHFVSEEGLSGRQTGETPVCCSCTGGFYGPSNFSRWWSRYRETMGFSSLKLHELRHTQASMLLGSGIDLKTVQSRLGHADASMTLNVYGHMIPANDQIAADVMGALMDQQAPTAKIIPLNRKTA